MTEYTIERVNQIYDGNDGEATKTMYEALKAIGPVGEIACNVFRAEKNSQRAKGYRSRRSTGKAYDTKGWAISNLCDLLTRHYVEHGIEWGWGVDSKMAAEDPHRHVLYVQTPFGPCSFHSDYRGKGPDWPHEWDGLIGASRVRVCAWVARLFAPHRAPRPMKDAPRDGTPIIVALTNYSGMPDTGHYGFERVGYRKSGNWGETWMPVGNDNVIYGQNPSEIGWWPDGTPESEMEIWPRTNWRWVPSNGSEGDGVYSAMCARCIRERAVVNAEDPNEAMADGKGCEIFSRTLAYPINHPLYPEEWNERDGERTCKAFEADTGQPNQLPRCTETPDLFGEQ